MSLRCPYCRGALAEAAPLRCRACATQVHAECAELHGRCVVLGCRGAGFEPAGGPAPPSSLRYRAPLATRARRAAGPLLVAPLEAPVLLAAAGLAALGWICALAP